ncbi:MAG: hypothetical protein AB8B36_13620 [Prochlorococcus sp.]
MNGSFQRDYLHGGELGCGNVQLEETFGFLYDKTLIMKHLILFPLLFVAVASHSSELANCVSLRQALNVVKERRDLDMKADRRAFIQGECGSESASWMGGAAGARRYQYMSCMSSARRKFKKQWAASASEWDTQINNIKAELDQSCLRE